jgi:hypothetical protein
VRLDDLNFFDERGFQRTAANYKQLYITGFLHNYYYYKTLGEGQVLFPVLACLRRGEEVRCLGVIDSFCRLCKRGSSGELYEKEGWEAHIRVGSCVTRGHIFRP